jgi:hypothetical protein
MCVYFIFYYNFITYFVMEDQGAILPLPKTKEGITVLRQPLRLLST